MQMVCRIKKGETGKMICGICKEKIEGRICYYHRKVICADCFAGLRRKHERGRPSNINYGIKKWIGRPKKK